jgi:hypothetical protein
MDTDRPTPSIFAKKRHTDTVQQALDGAAERLINGQLNKYLADVFFGNDQFGPEPEVEFSIKIRRDPATPGKFSYMAKTKVSHDLGSAFRLHGLSGQAATQS